MTFRAILVDETGDRLTTIADAETLKGMVNEMATFPPTDITTLEEGYKLRMERFISPTNWATVVEVEVAQYNPENAMGSP